MNYKQASNSVTENITFSSSRKTKENRVLLSICVIKFNLQKIKIMLRYTMNKYYR